MLTLAFWIATGERAARTFAQTAAGLLVGDGLGLLAVDWISVGSVAGLAAVVSVLTSVAAAGATNGSPSLVRSEVLDKGKHEA